MIPHRMLSNELAGSGLKNRVTACRKRLRENRVTLKAHASTPVEELFPEAHTHSSFEDEQRRETQTLLQIEEQEVGIT
jgi:hypothetical protein